MLPPITEIEQDNTHRLIPAKYAEGDRSVLSRLASNRQNLDDLFELDAATNERLAGEANLLPGITVHELVFGVPYYHIVNAAFTHPQPSGSRFNGSDRGAWYAGFELQTSQDEVAFHFGEELREIPTWKQPETRAYREFLADFRAAFHDIRGNSAFAPYLNPNSYVASQGLARDLLNRGSAGIVYPSVRHAGGTCIGCFRPALVTKVREGCTVSVTFETAASPAAIEVMPAHRN